MLVGSVYSSAYAARANGDIERGLRALGDNFLSVTPALATGAIGWVRRAVPARATAA
jgi:hypothetical protein